jgi:hypothetical protein
LTSVQFTSAFLISGCVSGEGDRSGTLVGNPGETSLTIAPADGVSYSRVDAPLSTLKSTGCDDSKELTTVSATIDILSDETITLPSGQWCELRLEFSGPLEITGTAGTGTFTLQLDVGKLNLSTTTPFSTDTLVTILELGEPDWLDPVKLDLADGQDVSVAPGGPVHNQLVAALKAGTALYEDLNADGDLDEDERAAGTLAGDEDEDEDEDEDDTGS